MLGSYQNLKVWQRNIDLVTEIYRLTEFFPKSEMYGLTNQMKRAAVSIPSNLSEGYTRKHRQEYIQFSRISFGSGAELETQIIIAKKLNFAPAVEFRKADELLSETMKMLNKLISSLSKNV